MHAKYIPIYIVNESNKNITHNHQGVPFEDKIYQSWLSNVYRVYRTHSNVKLENHFISDDHAKTLIVIYPP